jgi:predicted RNA-binding protein YlxR (DUF448 family)
MIACKGEILLDEQQVMPGRGAYIHPELDCVTKINQVGRWERALKLTSGSIRLDVLAELAKRLIVEVSDGVRSGESEGSQAIKLTGREASRVGAKKFRL